MMRKTINRFKKFFYYLLYSRRFISYHYSSKIVKPIIITPKYISIGKYVLIYHHSRIQGIYKSSANSTGPVIVFEDNTSVQQNLHLTCAKSIKVGKNTAIAANVTITDINHSYLDINLPVEAQQWEVNPVEIGEDCKIYNNSIILPGTKLGKHNVVGANSVVAGIYPDYSIIVGSPAKIIKRYNFETKKWQKTNSKGEFISE